MTTNLTKKFSTSTLEGQENFTIIIWEVFVRSEFLNYMSHLSKRERGIVHGSVTKSKNLRVKFGFF
jgi:hypothetical protein